MMKTIETKCDSCNVLVINNLICHEQGCPEAWKGVPVECKWCGNEFDPDTCDQRFCDTECAESYLL